MSVSNLARPAAFAAVLALMLGSGGIALAERKITAEGWADSLRHVQVNGTDLAYLDVGKGEPLVLVHGTSADYRTWLGELEPLSKQYRVIAYSRRYHFPNKGGGDGRNYSEALHERDLAALIETLGLGKVTLIGHSSGASIATRVAIDYPELVRSLVLAEPTFSQLMVGTKHEEQFDSEWRLVFARAQQSLANDFPDLGLTAVAEWAFGEEALQSMSKTVKKRLMDNASALKLQMLSNTRSAPISRDTIKGLSCRILYVEGARSPWHAHAMGDEFVKCLPATQRIVMKGVSHGMVWDDARGFSKAVIEFLGRNAMASE